MMLVQMLNDAKRLFADTGPRESESESEDVWK